MNKFLKYTGFVIVILIGYISYTASIVATQAPETLEVGQGAQDTSIGFIDQSNSIKKVSTLEQLKDVKSSELITLKVKNVEPTGIYLRKPWIGEIQHSKTRAGRYRYRDTQFSVREVSTSWYLQRHYRKTLYVVTLEDGTRVAAMIEPRYLSQAQNQSEITLPVGKKLNLSKALYSQLKNDGDSASESKHLFYGINDQWYKDNSTWITTKAIIIGVLVSGALILLGIYLKKRICRKTLGV